VQRALLLEKREKKNRKMAYAASSIEIYDRSRVPSEECSIINGHI
jgi:hypothetical protein